MGAVLQVQKQDARRIYNMAVRIWTYVVTESFGTYGTVADDYVKESGK